MSAVLGGCVRFGLTGINKGLRINVNIPAGFNYNSH